MAIFTEKFQLTQAFTYSKNLLRQFLSIFLEFLTFFLNNAIKYS